jgi:hypothetical protein
MASAVLVDPQSFNRYSYVSNRPLSFVDPTGMFRVSTGGCVGGDLVGGVLPGDETIEQLQQRRPKPRTQSTPTPKREESPVPSSVTPNVGDPKPYGNLPLGPNFYFSGMGSLIEFTVSDQNGNPMSDVTVIEMVTPASTIQNSSPVTRADGKIVDLVGQGSFDTPRTDREARDIARNARETPQTVVQDHVMVIISSSGKTSLATHQRIFSNVDASGHLNPVFHTNGYSNNYTITVSEIKVTPIQRRICLGRL